MNDNHTPANLRFEEDGGGDSILLCPCCGHSPNLHHFRVEVFDRDEGDKGQGPHVVSTHKRVHTDLDMTHNPSSRRGGLLVYFWCEQCGDKSELSIAQHKGCTYLKFGPSDRPLDMPA